MRGVFIPDGAVARDMAKVLERGLAVIMRTDAVRPPDVLFAVLAELRHAASVHGGTGGIPAESPPATLPTMSVSAAAEQLRVSPRAVTALCQRGTLPGLQARRKGPWRLHPDDVADYAARREGVV